MKKDLIVGNIIIFAMTAVFSLVAYIMLARIHRPSYVKVDDTKQIRAEHIQLADDLFMPMEKRVNFVKTGLHFVWPVSALLAIYNIQALRSQKRKIGAPMG